MAANTSFASSVASGEITTSVKDLADGPRRVGIKRPVQRDDTTESAGPVAIEGTSDRQSSEGVAPRHAARDWRA